MNPLIITVYTDIACPWCIIGLHRLDKVLRERFAQMAVDIRHEPLLLMPDCPGPGVNLADLLRQRGVADPAQAWARPQAEARASGLALDLALQPFAYPTLRAHTLIRGARQRGTQHALAGAIIRAYFLQARNTHDAGTLADLAIAHGFDRNEALALIQDPHELALTVAASDQARAQGVNSVPHLVIDEYTLVGCRSEDEIAGAIEQVRTSAYRNRHSMEDRIEK